MQTTKKHSTLLKREKVHQSTIVGSRPRGFIATHYTVRPNLKPLVFEGDQPGGQLTITTEVENYPGYEHGIQGPEMMNVFRKQAQRFGADCRFETVTKVDLSHRPFKVWLGARMFATETLIIAT